jgi:hypothetical protein
MPVMRRETLCPLEVLVISTDKVAAWYRVALLLIWHNQATTCSSRDGSVTQYNYRFGIYTGHQC